MRSGAVLRDRYELRERIAAGGMGEVWRAVDLNLRRPVAIKVLHPALADDPEFRHRFMREARMLAALNAQGLIDLYDACEDSVGDGHVRSYLVMELVSGDTLATILASQGRLAVDRVLPLIAQVAAALDVAHRAGIIHRDVKPANVMVTPDDRATVIDFGIAVGHGNTSLTAAGSVLGTVDYASPEQLRGESVTPASDIYSLGVVAYECVTGALPFWGDSPAAVIAGHLNQEPPPIDSVPSEVSAVIMRALSKDPTQRFSSAAEFAEAINATIGGRGTQLLSAGQASVPPAATTRIEYEPEPGLPEPATLAQQLRHRTIMTASITLGIVALVIGAVVLFGNFNQASSDDPDSADESTTMSSPSPSPSPSPTGPDQPAQSTLYNVRSQSCIGLDFGWFNDDVVLTSCDDDGVSLAFVPNPNADGVFQLTYDHDGEQGCVSWRYGDDKVKPGSCDFQTAWKLAWVETEGGYDVWRIQSANNSAFCLASNGDTVQGQNCTKDDNQLWRTTAVEP